jgi:malonyl CoA-acyl carrier protein transacylase
MGKIAFVFPGQGAQAVGMGKDAHDASPAARAMFERADAALGFALSRIIFEGPEDELRLTVNTQPALLTVSAALLELVKDRVKPDYVAGHSLGEYSALVAAGVLSFEDAVRAVRLRGEFMEAAVPAGQGAMAAVLGAERGALQALCEAVSADTGLVVLANVNCPGQIVVSGTAEGVRAVVERGKEEAGAKRVIPLEVSGPFHSPLMQPAADRLEQVLAELEMRDAEVPVIANVTAEPVTAAEEIRGLLKKQVTAPVLWEDTVNRLIGLGVDTFVEIGSGTVLTGLIRKTAGSAKVHTVNSMASLDAVLAELAP